MSRVDRREARRARDEFIDDIPYPETQNYVKRILGTAEDYRRLYSEGGGRLVPGAPGTATLARDEEEGHGADPEVPPPRLTDCCAKSALSASSAD